MIRKKNGTQEGEEVCKMFTCNKFMLHVAARAGVELVIGWQIKECCDSDYYLRVSGRKYRLFKSGVHREPIMGMVDIWQKCRTRKHGDTDKDNFGELEFDLKLSLSSSCPRALSGLCIEARLGQSGEQSDHS